MFRVELHEGIKQIFEVFYRLRFWSRSDQPTVKEERIKIFCIIYYSLFSISLVARAIKTDNTDDRILLFENAIIATVILIKCYHLIWNQTEFIELCHRICSYSVDDPDEFTVVNRKFNILVKVATYFLYLTCTIGCITSAVVPFVGDMIDGIELHKDMEESIQHVESFFSNVFALQLATSALCICASVYCLTYIKIENLVELVLYLFYLFYNIFDIFMIMYLGNEINLSSDRLSYCLFESDWTDRSELTKKCMIIFGERLKQAQELVILKLYPMILETFMKILNSAYSMFNILKSLA